MKKWKLIKYELDGKTYYDLYDNERNFTPELALSHLHLPDIFDCCGGKDKVDLSEVYK